MKKSLQIKAQIEALGEEYIKAVDEERYTLIWEGGKDDGAQVRMAGANISKGAKLLACLHQGDVLMLRSSLGQYKVWVDKKNDPYDTDLRRLKFEVIDDRSFKIEGAENWLFQSLFRGSGNWYVVNS